MNDLDRHHEKQEMGAARRDALIFDEIESINATDSEHVFKTYASDLHNIWSLFYDAPDLGERLIAEIKSCIKLEAEQNVDNRLGGG